MRFRFFLWLQAAAFALATAGCASLPDVRELKTSLSPQDTPTVSGGNGALSAKRAESALAKRLRSTSIDQQALAALEEAATGTPLILGNKVTLLYDGPQTMASMMDAIRGATDHINLETYIFDEDALGLEFAQLLMEKQRAGVQVNIIYDSIGTLRTPPAFFDSLRASGIALLEFNPVNPFKRLARWRLNNRDHRKILVIDGRIAFTGGINITDDYSSGSIFRSSRKRVATDGWRDTHAKIEGPAVASFQWLFMQTWTAQKNEDLEKRQYFPPLKEVGDQIVRVIASAPDSDHEIYKAYILAIQESQVSIHLTNAYFVPDVQLIETLTDAARRGVDVKIVFPSVSDASIVLYAGRSFYDTLLDAGVKIYELKKSVLHAKTAVIDRYWSTVGSTNLDMRSFLHNNEVNLVVYGEQFALGMEAAFEEDLRNSIEITPEEWKKRSAAARLKEWMARRMAYWL